MSASVMQGGHKKKRKKIVTTAAKYNGLPIAMGSHDNVLKFDYHLCH